MLDKNSSSKRKTVTATLLLTLLVTALAGTLFVNLGMADPFPPPPSYLPVVSITIHSVAYDENSVSLTFTANVTSNFSNRFYLFLDSRDDYVVFDPAFNGSFYSSTIHRFLSNGSYTAWVRTASPGKDFMRAGLWYWTGISNTVSFTVDTARAETGPVQDLENEPAAELSSKNESSASPSNSPDGSKPPKVSIISPKNETYVTKSIQLNFIIYEEVSWVSYSLDGKDNFTVKSDYLSQHPLAGKALYWKGNVTIKGLSDGVHNVTVYAEDFDGSIGTSSCIFTVGQEARTMPEQGSKVEPSLVAASAIAVAVPVIATGLLFYFKKRKR